jgi:SAM-dependent methyltransferase
MTAAPACPLCGGAGVLAYESCLDLEYFIEASYPFHRCAGCGFVFMHPLPTREELPSLYPSDYRNYEVPANPLSAYLVDRFHAHHVAVSRRLLPAGGSFLEVGSAGGDVLRRLRDRGFENVRGVEISQDGVAASRAKGLRVFCGTLEEFSTDERFDLILMSHVIEHVLDPVATVAKTFALLEPGGRLYIETPNVRSLDARLWGPYWGLVHYPRHVTLFDRATLRRLLEGAGFEVEKMSWEINSCGWALSIQSALRRAGIDRSRRPRSFYYPLLLAATLPVNLVDVFFGGTAFMSAIARKGGAD